MKFVARFIAISLCLVGVANASSLKDEARNRDIPLEITKPSDSYFCSKKFKCPVVFLSPGYGVAHTEYQYLTTYLSQLGYMIISVDHELAGDPPLATEGDLSKARQENWKRGAKTLQYIQSRLQFKHKEFDFSKVTLIGHSNGGDISAWLANDMAMFVDKVITLDNRRVALPRNKRIDVLSIRAGDFPADKGVLPTPSEVKKYGICVVDLPNAKHNEMTDKGSIDLQIQISDIVDGFISEMPCEELQNPPTY